MNVFDVLKREVKKEFNKDVEIDSTFKEVGIDSIDLLNFVIKIEEKFSISFSDNELLDLQTIRDIVDLINKKI